jgi:hypothetical protein
VKNSNKGEAGSWIATSGIPADTFIYGLSIDKRSPQGARILFVTSGNNTTRTGDVYRSTDDGLTWALVLSPVADAAARVTAVDCVDSNLVYAAGEGGFWRSTTGGGFGSWTLLATPADFVGTTVGNSLGALRWSGVAWIEADPKIPNRVYAACYGDTGTNRGLYRSDDKGATWTKIFTGDYVRRVAILSTNTDHIFLSSGRTVTSPALNSQLSLGVRRSTNGGTSWQDVNDNLPWTIAGALAVGAGTAYIVFAASMGNGFWRRSFGANEAGRPAEDISEETRGEITIVEGSFPKNPQYAFAGTGPIPVAIFDESGLSADGSITEESAPSQSVTEEGRGP